MAATRTPGKTEDLIGRTIAKHMHSKTLRILGGPLQINNIYSSKLAWSESINPDCKFF